MIYLKASAANRELMSYDDNGERISSYFLKARNRADLAKRTETHRKLSEAELRTSRALARLHRSFVTE